jgi:2-iminobutanoate/2-iminopropanoate deaminase
VYLRGLDITYTAGGKMVRDIIYSKSAPEPIGPYSQAIRTEQLIFTSGQIALDAFTDKLVSSDIRAQTHKVLENLEAVLRGASASLQTVVKTTIFLKDMNDFGEVNEVYAEYFGVSLPARSTVEVARLPKDVLVEIDCIALVSDS